MIPLLLTIALEVLFFEQAGEVRVYSVHTADQNQSTMAHDQMTRERSRSVDKQDLLPSGMGFPLSMIVMRILFMHCPGHTGQ